LKDHNAFFLASSLHGLFDRENEGGKILCNFIVIYQSTWHNNSDNSNLRVENNAGLFKMIVGV
jgi:hypothetical protein